MSTAVTNAAPSEDEEERRKQQERPSADEILEDAVDLTELGLLDALGDAASAVGDFLGGLCDLG